MALHTERALHLELQPSLETHLRKHFGRQAILAPDKGPTAAPNYHQPHTEL